jgi:hypothetical protein
MLLQTIRQDKMIGKKLKVDVEMFLFEHSDENDSIFTRCKED